MASCSVLGPQEDSTSGEYCQGMQPGLQQQPQSPRSAQGCSRATVFHTSHSPHHAYSPAPSAGGADWPGDGSAGWPVAGRAAARSSQSLLSARSMSQSPRGPMQTHFHSSLNAVPHMQQLAQPSGVCWPSSSQLAGTGRRPPQRSSSCGARAFSRRSSGTALDVVSELEPCIPGSRPPPRRSSSCGGNPAAVAAAAAAGRGSLQYQHLSAPLYGTMASISVPKLQVTGHRHSSSDGSFVAQVPVSEACAVTCFSTSSAAQTAAERSPGSSRAVTPRAAAGGEALAAGVAQLSPASSAKLTLSQQLAALQHDVQQHPSGTSPQQQQQRTCKPAYCYGQGLADGEESVYVEPSSSSNDCGYGAVGSGSESEEDDYVGSGTGSDAQGAAAAAAAGAGAAADASGAAGATAEDSDGSAPGASAEPEGSGSSQDSGRQGHTGYWC